MGETPKPLERFVNKPKTITIIGAGQRGFGFAELIRPCADWGRVVAVAEPRDGHRATLAREFNIPAEHAFAHWQDLVAQPELCDAVVIATPDAAHAGPAIAFLAAGCDVLLEKPMAPTLADCQAIELAQRKSGKILAVCHSLRYQSGFRRVKELVAAGAIGRVMTLDLIEQVAFWHQAHSFVRGNWSNAGRSSPMLLAKSCHDIDYIAYLVDKPCLRVSSFGALSYFRRENAPPDSTDRCTDPCPVEPTCAYSANKQYVETNREAWPASVVSLDHSREAHVEAIRTGPYGRCVWKCDNDAVDHQVVNLLFADDVTATFTMTAFTQGGGRRLRVHGTMGELTFDEREISIKTFADGQTTRINVVAESGGHGGGDRRVVEEWLRALHSRDASAIVANAQESLKTHTIVFAAEESRRTNQTVTVAEFAG